jgi:hypothetical protein
MLSETRQPGSLAQEAPEAIARDLLDLLGEMFEAEDEEDDRGQPGHDDLETFHAQLPAPPLGSFYENWRNPGPASVPFLMRWEGRPPWL